MLAFAAIGICANAAGKQGRPGISQVHPGGLSGITYYVSLEGNIGDYEGDHNIFHNYDFDRAVVVGYRDEFTLDQVAAGFWTQYSRQDWNSLAVYDPENDLFLNWHTQNFRLASGSRAIDAGGSLEAPAVDFDCMRRPAGFGFDIGAFEFGSIPSPECAVGEAEPAAEGRKKSGKHRK